MTWQVAISLHMIFSVAYYLIHRSISKQFFSHAKVAVAFMYLFFVTPLGAIYGVLNYDINLSFPILIWIFFIISGVLYTLHNITAYQSNAHIDAAQFAILSNLASIFVVIIATIFLSERLSLIQLVGVAILVFSAGLVSIRRTTKRIFEISRWSWLAVLSALFVAIGVTFEKYLLGEMNIGTYMVLGWGFQTLTMTIVASKEWHTLKDFNRIGIAKLSSLGMLRFLQGITFVVALNQVNVSLLASITTYKSVLIFIGGVIFLNEKNHLLVRFFGSILATIGLLLVFN